MTERDCVLPDWAYDLPADKTLEDVDPCLALAYNEASGNGLDPRVGRDVSEIQAICRAFQDAHGNLQGGDLPLIGADKIDMSALGRLVSGMRSR